MSEERKIFTLEKVLKSIQKTISERYSSAYWVQAEMHKLNFTNKGHCYPELVQKENGKLVAEMRGTIWKNTYDRISKNFVNVVKEPLHDGMNLLFLVKINFHPLYGLGLEVLDIDPTFSLGELHKEREESLKRLQKEGVLNANQQLPFPLLPQRVAIISVESSKGLSDFYSIVKNNPWNYAFYFHLFTAQLNGDPAIESIQKQLKRIEKVKHHFDCVAIIRGGGGEIGLSCYNNFELAKAIATFPLPVLTGIGHSTNITVSELVSFRNSITPTDLADFLIQCFHQFAVPVTEAQKTIVQRSKRILVESNKQFKNEIRVFKQVSFTHLQRVQTALKTNIQAQENTLRKRFVVENNQLKQEVSALQKGAKANRLTAFSRIELSKIQLQKAINKAKQRSETTIQDYIYFLRKEVPKRMLTESDQLFQMEKNIRLVDPENVLKRGYSIALFEGKSISKTTKLGVGAEIEIRTHEMEIRAKVEKVESVSPLFHE